MFDLKENDEEWNDAQRAKVREIADAHGEAWLAVLNPHGGRGGHDILRKWNGEPILNFTADIVVPCRDDELLRLIANRDEARYTGVADDRPRVEAILERVRQIGGSSLVWT